MLKVCELFGPTIQGEGRFAGTQSIFVRTTGCNLRCVFKDSICDTAYSSFKPEKPIFETFDELIQAFKQISQKCENVNHVVITGGEPLLQKEALKEFLIAIFKIRKDWIVTIETNGTMPILDTLTKDYRISLYSVSPKLSTSVDNDHRFLSEEQALRHNDLRINYKNLFNIVTSGVPYQFKFVYSGGECIQEIKDIYSKMSKFVNMGDDNELRYWMRNHPNKNTMLMPEGINKEQLDKNCLPTVEAALANGWSYTDRLHIRLWNDEKGV
jgi:7-carboxy-7-deazaguanine synthase